MTYRAFDFRFSIGGTATEVVDEMSILLGSLEYRSGQESPTVSIDLDSTPSGRFELFVDGEQHFETGDVGVFVHQVVWEITQRAIQTRENELMLHAGAVVIDECTVLISGLSGAGKSTLTRALLDEGARYLTDEAVQIGPDGQITDALRRPIQLDERSTQMLDLEVLATHPVHPDSSRHLPVPQESLQGGPIPDRTAIILLGGNESPANMSPRRSQVVAHLISGAFDPGRRAAAGLERTAALASRSHALNLPRATVSEHLNTVSEFVKGNLPEGD